VQKERKRKQVVEEFVQESKTYETYKQFIKQLHWKTTDSPEVNTRSKNKGEKEKENRCGVRNVVVSVGVDLDQNAAVSIKTQ